MKLEVKRTDMGNAELVIICENGSDEIVHSVLETAKTKNKLDVHFDYSHEHQTFCLYIGEIDE